MTAFLKIDECQACHRSLPWEWIPAVLMSGKPLAGTGVWHSQLSEGRCPDCVAAREVHRQKEAHTLIVRHKLVQLLGGQKPYREFTFERYEVQPGNRAAYERSRQFDPTSENLYLWGPCGVGKTHLAYAAARRSFEETLAVAILPAAQLTRRVRMRSPLEEQAVIDELTRVQVLVLDDLGVGTDTAFHRQVLQEILDGRDADDRGGLVVTSKFSLDDLAAKLADDSLSSRLAGMCGCVKVIGPDRRLDRRSSCARTDLRQPGGSGL